MTTSPLKLALVFVRIPKRVSDDAGAGSAHAVGHGEFHTMSNGAAVAIAKDMNEEVSITSLIFFNFVSGASAIIIIRKIAHTVRFLSQHTAIKTIPTNGARMPQK